MGCFRSLRVAGCRCPVRLWLVQVRDQSADLLRGSSQTRTRIDIWCVACCLLGRVADVLCPSRFQVQQRVCSGIQQLLELANVPADAHALDRPRHGLKVVGQRFVAAKVRRDVGDEHGAGRDRVDEVEGKRLARLDEAVKVAVEKRQAEEGEHVGEDEMEGCARLRVDDEVVERGRRGAVVMMRQEDDGRAVAAVGRVVGQVGISVYRSVALLSAVR